MLLLVVACFAKLTNGFMIHKVMREAYWKLHRIANVHYGLFISQNPLLVHSWDLVKNAFSCLNLLYKRRVEALLIILIFILVCQLRFHITKLQVGSFVSPQFRLLLNLRSASRLLLSHPLKLLFVLDIITFLPLFLPNGFLKHFFPYAIWLFQPREVMFSDRKHRCLYGAAHSRACIDLSLAYHIFFPYHTASFRHHVALKPWQVLYLIP